MSKYIKKADYIAMYGEEAWDAYAEKRREYSKQYAKEHKEELKEYKKQYYQDNKDHIVEQRKQYYQDNIEERREYGRQYNKTQWGRAVLMKLNYIRKDKEKGFPADQNIDEEWIIENIFNSKCIYCGESDWKKLGADRIDNSKPHTPDNVVCSCWDCNNKRNDKFTVEEFVQLMKKEKKE